MSRLTKLYTNAEESYIDLICFEDLDNYDVLYEVLDCGQYHGLIDAIYKLAEYENIGSVEDIMQKMNELEVYKRAFKNEIPTNYYELENVETDEQYIDLRLNQARKELEDEK